MNKMRHFMRLVEGTKAGSYYLHVSPGKNLESILRHGLIPNYGHGTYGGYYTSLDGIYVTQLSQIIAQQLLGKAIEEHYVIVLIYVSGPSVIDEDAIDDILSKSVSEFLTRQNLTVDEAIEKFEMDDPIWQKIVPLFLKELGPADTAVLANHPGIVEEFVETWIIEHIYGGETDALWWPEAKEIMVQAFPRAVHPEHGADYSRRIPHEIGYTGDTRIVAVIDVKNGHGNVVKGAVPMAAADLIASLDFTIG